MKGCKGVRGEARRLRQNRCARAQSWGAPADRLSAQFGKGSFVDAVDAAGQHEEAFNPFENERFDDLRQRAADGVRRFLRSAGGIRQFLHGQL